MTNPTPHGAEPRSDGAGPVDPPHGPLRGIRVVEVALGVTAVGAGLAANLPGALLRDLGAEVAHIRSAGRPTLDAGVEFFRSWDRDKEIHEVEDDRAAGTVRALARDADVLFVSGAESLVEQQGLGYPQLARENPALVGARIRPSTTADGAHPDLDLLVSARAGLCTQIWSHHAGRPAFPDLNVAQAGAALSATLGVLAGLYERENKGLGRWVETSLYDGLLGLTTMIIGRAEHPSVATALQWEAQGPAEALVYRCADGGYVQLWFGAKGAYDQFLEFMGDEPSEHGYNADVFSGALVGRGIRWARTLATRDRAEWLERMAGHDFRVEPALRPGEALLDDHVRAIGLSIERLDPERGRLRVLGPVATVHPAGPGDEASATAPAGLLLSGVRVLDLSAYLAGPVAGALLAELGADVLKVEPVGGDVHRAQEPMFAAGQRGKRAVGLNLKAPESAAVLARLFRWADVVHQNSRLGLAERLGYDEATVRAANPGVVYSFASGFGQTGPRAPLPANDQLMQALAGIEAAQGGYGAEPTYLRWGAIDLAGGWISACSILAALYARRRGGVGQSVSSSLLGAAMSLKSGAFVAGETVVEGPTLDGGQLGYGAAYRLYQGSDGAWLALAVPDQAAWDSLRQLIGGLAVTPPPLRTEGGEPQPEEKILEAAFMTRPAAVWVQVLRVARIPAEPVAELDRATFSERIVDDPVNHQLGRVIAFTWGDRGRLDQVCYPPRLGPGTQPRAEHRIPGLGEHTAEVLEAVGVGADERARLAAAGVIAPR